MVGIPGNQHAKGKHWTLSKETRERMSQTRRGNTNTRGKHWKWSEVSKLAKLGDKNPMWKGDKPIHKTSLHQWVRCNWPKPELCQTCGINPALDLANITGIYERDFKNWKYLCRRCHMLSDGRILKNLRWWDNKRTISDETRERMRQAHLGNNNLKGKHWKQSAEALERRRVRNNAKKAKAEGKVNGRK